MTAPKDPPLQRGGGRVLMIGGLGLAVAAAAVLALGAEDVSLLRLGLLAALWAALFGAFATVRLRRELSVGAERADELHKIYRLELDREIAARREHELTVERELREQAERRESDELAALRSELQSLRETLRNLLGGDVLVERVALRAESTRLLPLSDRSRPMVDVHATVDGGTAGPARSLTAAEQSRPPSPSQPPPRRERAPAAAAQAEPDIFTRTVTELAGAGEANPADRSWSPAVAGPSGSARSSQTGTVSAAAGSVRAARGWQPAVSPGPLSSDSLSSGSPPARPRRAEPRLEPPPVPPPPVSPSGPVGAARSGTFQNQDTLGGVARPGTGTGRHSRPSLPRYGAAPASTGNGTHGSNGAHSNGTHSNGTHSNGTHSNGTHSNGTHSSGNGVSGGGSHAARQGGTTGRRAAPEAPASPPTGGRRVDELLAAYGDGAVPRRRRRRAED